MSDSPIALVRGYVRDRRDLARARRKALDLPKAESVAHASWYGLDTTTRDLAVEASVLGELLTDMLGRTDEGQRLSRWGERDRIEGSLLIGPHQWSGTIDQVTAMASAIEHLLQEAANRGAALNDMTVTVQPGSLGVRVSLSAAHL